MSSIDRIAKLTRASLAALAVATTVVVSQTVVAPTFGGFSGTTKSAGSKVTAGTLTMTNTKSGAVFSITNGLPGTTSSQSLTITNSGSLSASAVTVTLGSLLDQTCAANGAQGGVSCPSGVGTGTLSSVATVSIVDTTHLTGGNPTSIASGTVSSVATGGSPAGTYTLTGNGAGGVWAAGESHTLTLTLTIPSTVTNAVQGTSVSFALTWKGVQ